LRPAIVHSRNLAALEVAMPAWAAGVPVRIHGEHGRDVGDLDGSNSRKYQWLRRFYRPFVTRYIALSRDLEDYLTCRVGSESSPGVTDLQRCRCAALSSGRDSSADCRLPVFRSALLAGGYRRAHAGGQGSDDSGRGLHPGTGGFPQLLSRLRLVMIGDGPLRAQAQAMLEQAGVAELAWLPGQRDDVPEILRGLDCFVLPSLAEGVSNTILEAMASGLPVIATDVGGNGELIEARVVRASWWRRPMRGDGAEDRRLRDDPQAARAAGSGGTGRGRAALQPGSDDAALPGSLRSVLQVAEPAMAGRNALIHP
jgi:hypothetical protein